MQNEKILLKSSEPLEDEGKKLSVIYIIVPGCGLLWGLCTGSYFMTFLLVVFGIPIGWGIKNLILKQKCWQFRYKRFLANEKPSYPELYQRLLPVFNSLNIEVKLNADGSICIPYGGLTYEVRYNADDSFSVRWSQSFFKAVLRMGYYISLYKKIRIAMGIIAYHVQQACLTQNYFVSGVQEEKAEEEKVEEEKKEIADVCSNDKNIEHKTDNVLKKFMGRVQSRYGIWGCVFVAVVASIIFFMIMGKVCENFFGNSMWYYADMLEEYQCDTGDYSKREVYDMIVGCYEDYNTYGLAHFQDLTVGYTLPIVSEFMSNNDDYIGTYVYMNGTVICNTGNIVEIQDEITFSESVQNEILSYVFDNVDALQYGADVSLLQDIDASAFMPGDYVEVIGMYCGKIRLRNGSYTPAIIAVDMYKCSPDFSF